MSFEEFRALYPARVGSQRWGDAERFYKARLKEGHTDHEILEGTKRYAKFLKATGKYGTEYVMQAASFLGRNKGFLEDWLVPMKEGDTMRRPEKLPTLAELKAIEARKAEMDMAAEADYEAKRLGLEPRRANEPVKDYYNRVKLEVTRFIVGKNK